MLTKCCREKFSIGSQTGKGSNKTGLDFKFSPCSLCSVFSFGYFPGVWVLKCRHFGTLYRFHLLRQVKEDGTDRGFRNVGILNLRRRGNTQKKTYYTTRKVGKTMDALVGAMLHTNDRLGSLHDHYIINCCWPVGDMKYRCTQSEPALCSRYQQRSLTFPC